MDAAPYSHSLIMADLGAGARTGCHPLEPLESHLTPAELGVESGAASPLVRVQDPRGGINFQCPCWGSGWEPGLWGQTPEEWHCPFWWRGTVGGVTCP